uniref:ALMS motif domain-containing protein n=1 Tax=Syphacia muris TaxID=451379 RepID=A0A0N5AAG3_9BILA
MHRSVNATTANLQILTPNQKAAVIKNERKRRRIIRCIQVRQQCKNNAMKVREKVKLEQRKEVELIKQELTDAVARRRSARRVLAPTQPNVTETSISTPHRRRRQLTEDELLLIEQRHRNALLKLRKQQQERKAKTDMAINLKKRAVREANLRSKRNLQSS